MTFTSSLEGLYSSPHLITHKVDFTQRWPVLELNYTSKAASVRLKYALSISVLLIAFCSSPDSDGVFGRVPQSILDDEGSHLITAHENSLDLQNLHRVSENAYKQYLKSRPNPSAESIRRVKSTDLSSMAVHPLLGQFRER